MSDTIVVDETPNNSKYFCHSCSSSFCSANFECPNCQSGFIEEIVENVNDTEQESDNPQILRVLHDLTRINPVLSQSGNNSSPYYRIANEILTPIIMGASGSRPDGDLNREFYRNVIDSADGGRHQSQRRLGPVNFENILQEILVLISDGANPSDNAATPMFFLGNPGDYAWGREGLDSIVTQLLNQMDNAGPPPLEKEKIAEIPKVEVTLHQVEKEKLQCSVCWDDFKLNETVRKLPCTHIFHECCIIPWLELHGTCPICRKSLNSEHLEGNAMTLTNEQAQVNNLETDIANYYHTANSFNVGVGNEEEDNDGSNNIRNTRNSRRHDDGNIDFDFD
ncbi:unnamed protein product [Diamesa serratosioi]